MPLRVHKADSAAYAWRLTDERGRLVAASVRVYPDRADAEAEADRFRLGARDAELVGPTGEGLGTDAVFLVTGRDGSWAWVYADDEGDIARSGIEFESTDAVAADVGRVRDRVRDTPGVVRAPSAFDPEVLEHVLVTLPLQQRMAAGRSNDLHRVIIELHQDYPGGLSRAQEAVIRMVRAIVDSRARHRESQDPFDRSRRRSRLLPTQTTLSYRYVVADLTPKMVGELVEADGREAARPASESPSGSPTTDPRPGTMIGRAIYRIWPDFAVRPLLHESGRTVKADAARAAFAARGDGVVWAVLDSGVDASHPHLADALDLPAGLQNAPKDFVDDLPERPLEDPFGHGTHVAGIIAGEVPDDAADDEGPLYQLRREPDDQGEPVYRARPVGAVQGVAPGCKILSVRVLDENGNGHASDVIAALQYVGSLNRAGRDLKVHGVNLSIGYDFDPEWYACGHSPLCREVDHLVRSGVVVVAAAGNTGHGTAYADARTTRTGMDLTINDPGNAERAITVGSTHTAEPHRYGVSYFSSKGPTGDGRAKPDLVAPGERVLSCAAGKKRSDAENKLAALAARDPEADLPTRCHYVTDSGTSMAAPHVSGVIAAFLSVRREFVGRTDEIKDLFLRTATDLGRDRYFQGHGLIDLMRALQDV